MHNDIDMRYDRGMIRRKTMNNAWQMFMMAIIVMIMKMTMATMGIQMCDKMDDQKSYSDHKVVEL